MIPEYCGCGEDDHGGDADEEELCVQERAVLMKSGRIVCGEVIGGGKNASSQVGEDVFQKGHVCLGSVVILACGFGGWYAAGVDLIVQVL